jgi:hypothetical protein
MCHRFDVFDDVDRRRGAGEGFQGFIATPAAAEEEGRDDDRDEGEKCAHGREPYGAADAAQPGGAAIRT